MSIEINEICNIVQTIILAIPAIKCGRDYLNKPSKFDDAILSLEKAIFETHGYISNCENQTNNRRLEEIWLETAKKLDGIVNLENLTNIAFKKALYWQGPKYYSEKNSLELDKIRLTEVIKQFENLRTNSNIR
ncbi:hypothetical protein [Psychrilyobacter sp.]|uniref:hypothetical protein n=1 Tax=Psychrilyobacter sp. TaxID=2586924 RepID=UPI003017A40A